MSTAATGIEATLLDADRAGFWRRFVASFVDAFVLFVADRVIAVALAPSTASGTLLSLAVSAAYFAWFHGRTGQTPGDAALSIRVVDLRDGTGRPVGYVRALTRWAGSLLSAIPLLLGYFWMLWDDEKQTWHDKLAGSVVVDLQRRG